uniref:Glycosyltransferase family 1 protein n=1 Tax=Eiseniibacteriota bacterium TaxID=2212470 RepID=A0A832I013_UNCEI
MRIGIVSQSYYPRFGGVTEHVHHTAAELQRRGHAVVIVTSRFRDGNTDHGVPVERVGHNVLVPFNRAFVDFTVGFGLKGQLERLFRRYDFDVLHVHCPLAPTLPLMAIERAPCPVAGTFHSTGGRSLLQDAFRGPLRRRVERLDARIAVSETARASAELYFPGDYVIVPNGVDVDRFHPSVAPFEEWRDPERVNVLFVGRLDPRKGVHVLLAAWPEVVARTGGRVRLLIVGDSYLRPRFEAAVPPAMRPHVRFLGHVPIRDLPRWYATGDIFVSPATGNESFGIVLVEAMAAGRPVVCSDIPGYRCVVTPGRDGVCVRPGDPAALARALAALVDDPERRAALAARGRQRALEFAWPRVTDRIEAVYRSIAGRRALCSSAA